MKNKWTLFFLILIGFVVNTFALPSYLENNQGEVAFDISNPIDATGYTLQGKHLKGGDIHFQSKGVYVAPLLAHDWGNFKLPTSLSLKNKPLIKTTVNYSAIKFIDPVGIHNLFIKIGMASRTQVVSGLDPYVLKKGIYTWRVPIFAVGIEHNDVDGKTENRQFMQVGTGDGPSHHNGMYTQQFYLYLRGKGNAGIAAHPQKTARLNTVLQKPVSAHFTCHADGIWGGGGSDPYRTMTGQCQGNTMTFPAGPDLDYEYGSFTLPTVHSPWTAAPTDHCIVNGKPSVGCTNIKIALGFHYIAQKIRVPINQHVTAYAEFGTAYRHITPTNLRYQCKDNVYLKKILPKKDCLKKSYLPGGSVYTYFAVGYAFQSKEGVRYSARYIYIPEQENADRLAWRDASATEIYAVSTSKKESAKVMQQNFNVALHAIRKIPAVYDVLGKHFFEVILKKNHLNAVP
ncbi:MAG: hypothetical protein COY58_09765 [Gammaproteobacteria bacterium CG_4_10_14_0_8_um_filter_38_16]|nr:MAG: hypothetical protein COY58_09765 [Gammaproteobacteria bacterium CG_4_10_14_0_8_um_filter_38_16]PJA03030.1 MAG: hypothetical protein COX72_06900 [Gammaproteobacteria bacterium CG_4_10_14_0_2_um_filter_38_22]PJB10240.1 MAG: hypothetical protein CO120_06015 [Gammaproteobacteria bacterium CG_4_9_14_3_um_filter_38_9]